MRRFGCFVVASMVVMAAPAEAQVTAPLNAPLPALVLPAPAPTTRLESFVPEAGSVVTLGYEELGTIGRGRIAVDVRQVRDSKGHAASGVTVLVAESQTRIERAFVDADEIPEVLQSLDALLAVRGNPTPFKKFEARVTTRGLLSFVAYSNAAGAIEYSVQVGRLLPTTILNLDAEDVLKMRGMLDAAQKQLNEGGR